MWPEPSDLDAPENCVIGQVQLILLAVRVRNATARESFATGAG
jgi:hypothetical protein